MKSHGILTSKKSMNPDSIFTGVARYSEISTSINVTQFFPVISMF